MGRKKRILFAALALAVALSSCAVQAPTVEDDGPEPTDPSEPTRPQDPDREGYTEADSLFSVNYDPDSSLNPLTTTNKYNEQLMGLIYEGLFTLTPQLEAEPVLCQDCSTEDGLTYTLSLRSGVMFHDGSQLSAEDVAYSLTSARSSAKFSTRLSDISSVSATEEGEVKIQLKRANYQLPKLLDVPIIKSGTASEAVPPGTGPYTMSGGVLTAFTGHREYDGDSLTHIYLRQVPEEELAENFSARNLDLLCCDPTGTATLNIHMVHENRYYDTSNLVYLGFNCRRTVAGDQLVRRAILRLIDRDGIVSDVYNSRVTVAPFILSPVLGLYTDADTAGYGFSKADFDRLAVVADIADENADGFLERAGEPFTLRFIVNTESPYKVQAARKITTDLRSAGFNVTLDELTYSQFTSALSAGNFDIYMGEARLRADLDMTGLFAGKLNYGKISDSEYSRLINEYLAAPEGEARVAAAKALDIYAAEDAAIIPICYKRYSVLTHVGVVSDARPSQSCLYTGVLQWTIDPGKR